MIPVECAMQLFLTKMYGDCQKGEVQKSLRNIKWVPAWGGGTLKVTTINHVAERLEQVVRELEKLPPHFKQYVVPSAGTYNWRVIAGTLQKSMHSYGAAIDINTKFSDYWRWPFPATTPVYKNRIPFEIVEVFEREWLYMGREMVPALIPCISSTDRSCYLSGLPSISGDCLAQLDAVAQRLVATG